MQPAADTPGWWKLAHGRRVALDRPAIVAILNVTPDSFSDGGRHDTVEKALAAAGAFAAAGAAMIDIGGESTRPGAARVGEEEQIRRVVPVVRALRAQPREGVRHLPLSVDTTLAAVAAAALDAGADAINDVSAATEDPGMLALAAARGAGLVLMHRLRPPGEDSYSDRYERAPAYADVVGEVRAWLAERADAALRAGVPRARIVLDPGLGFGKSVEQNLALVDRTRELADLGFPVMSGLSRKSFVGRAALGRDSTPEERLAGTLMLSARHRASGAVLFRVHDVAAHAALFG